MSSLVKRSYAKPFKTYEEQIELLLSKGLKLSDHSEAVRFLSYVNYYRFSGYAFIFKDSSTKTYRQDVSFEDIVALYRFDRELRSLVTDGIALIEVYTRTKIAHFIAEKYGPFGHANAGNFSDKRAFKNWLREIHQEAIASVNKKPFDATAAQHFRDVYVEWPNLPIWSLTEILPFGKLSRLFSLLGKRDQGKIANEFDLKSGKILDSWLCSLSATRNVCAHFERLWNRTIRIVPAIPNEYKWDFVRKTPHKIFPIFTIMKYTLDVIEAKTSESSDWKTRFGTIMESRPRGVFNDAFYQAQMGFVPDWEKQAIWKR